MNPELHRAHARRVRELTAAADWAALVRYWIAHEHKPAVEAAISLLRGRVLAGQILLRPLLDYLEALEQGPLDQDRAAATLLHLGWC